MPIPPDVRRSLASTVGKVVAARAERSKPLWKGPQEDGVTYSLLSRFLSDRERFRLKVVEGLRELDRFSHRLEYGQMWHHCEEATAAKLPWRPSLLAYAKGLVAKYRESGTEIEKWFQVCAAQYPIYLDYWAKHPDVKSRKPVLQEEVFEVKYPLPSGRFVKLKGKMDSVDLIDNGFYVQENKTKGEVDLEKIRGQLGLDLQSGIYANALEILIKEGQIDASQVGSGRIGIRYNVVRRPLGSHAKYSITQKKGMGKEKKGAETPAQFYSRLAGLIKADPKYFFVRFRMELNRNDMERMRVRVLNPILEQLCDWWEWIQVDPFDPWRPRAYSPAYRSYYPHGTKGPDIVNQYPNQIHYQFPYGVWNPLLEGRSTEYDAYLENGDLRGLTRVDNLFPELS